MESVLMHQFVPGLAYIVITLFCAIVVLAAWLLVVFVPFWWAMHTRDDRSQIVKIIFGVLWAVCSLLYTIWAAMTW